MPVRGDPGGRAHEGLSGQLDPYPGTHGGAAGQQVGRLAGPTEVGAQVSHPDLQECEKGVEKGDGVDPMTGQLAP